ncbi:MAG: phosphatase PAP2 family protein [Clostridia bacterium]|nr:phosphatase PAP2 family protein [Clostridia bacterium]
MLERIQSWDNKILLGLVKRRTPTLNRLMKMITFLGNNGYVWFAMALPMLLFNKLRLTGFTMLFALLISWLMSEVTIKNIVRRVRPCKKDFEQYLLIKDPPQYSFPSGHSATSFAVSTAMIFTCHYLFIPAVIIALLIAFSRVYIMVHYPTDVIVGALVGVICGMAAVPVAPYIPFFDFQF